MTPILDWNTGTLEICMSLSLKEKIHHRLFISTASGYNKNIEQNQFYLCTAALLPGEVITIGLCGLFGSNRVLCCCCCPIPC